MNYDFLSFFFSFFLLKFILNFDIKFSCTGFNLLGVNVILGVCLSSSTKVLHFKSLFKDKHACLMENGLIIYLDF